MNPLLIFDMDGTLFDTESIIVPATLQALKQLDLPLVPPEAIVSFVGEPMDRFCRDMVGKYGENLIQAFCAAVQTAETEMIRQYGQLYPGIYALLERLNREHFPLALCTNAQIPYMRLVTQSQQIASFFRCVKTRESDISKADMIREILQEMSTDNAIMIGDRYIDIVAAKEVGIPSIGVTYGFGQAEPQQATYQADNAEAIYQIALQHVRGMVITS